MSVILSVNEDLSGATARHLVNKKTYTRVFKVEYTVAGGPATPEEAATADDGGTSIPVINDSHNENSSAVCIDIDPRKEDGSRIHYNVFVMYETRTNPLPPTHPDPLDDDPVVTWGHWTIQEVIDKDNAGVAITNSAGDVYDPPPAADRHRMQVTIKRNEASYSAATADSFIDTVNDANVTIGGWVISPRNGKMTEFSAADAERDGTAYKVVTYVIQVNGDTWDLELLDQGLRQLNVDGGSGSGPSCSNNLVRIIDDEGEEVTTPWRLDGNGGRLSTCGTAEFNTYEWREETNWSSLNLPT